MSWTSLTARACSAWSTRFRMATAHRGGDSRGRHHSGGACRRRSIGALRSSARHHGQGAHQHGVERSSVDAGASSWTHRRGRLRGWRREPAHLLPYSTAKFAALGFTDGLAAELVGTGVTATSIVPGLMRTGSYDQAAFTGDAAAEHNWFSVAASAPLISADSTRAARRMVDGVLAGKPLVTVTPLAWMAYRVRGLMPGTTTRVMGIANRFLPRATGNAVPVKGSQLSGPPVVQRLTHWGRRAAGACQVLCVSVCGHGGQRWGLMRSG